MNFGRVFIVALLSVLLAFSVIWFFEPKTAIRSLLVISPVLLVMVLVLKKALDQGSDLTKQLQEGMRATLSSLDLEYLYVRDKFLYAIGTKDGYQLCFKYGSISENDWAGIPGVFSKVAVMGRFKIPNTENVQFHCAVLPENRTPSVRSMYGWQNPEPDFYVARAKSQNKEQPMQQFERLGKDTKKALKAVTAVFGGSCGIAPDWETVIVGKDEALKLAGNDPVKLTQLDFQFKIPFMIKAGELNKFLKTAGQAVALLSRDLGTKENCPG